VVVLGNRGGRLKTVDRFLQFPSHKQQGEQIPGHRTIANFYLPLLHAVGDKRDKFCEPDPNLLGIDQSSPLVKLLA